MAISTELKEIYSNYTDTRQYYDTVQLYHPTFKNENVSCYPRDTIYPSETLYPTDVNEVAQSYFLIRDTSNHTLNLESDTNILFEAYPFNVIQPQVGEDQQDIGIVLDNVSRELIQRIEEAGETSVPIKMKFRVYMDGDSDQQTDTITLSLTEVVVDMFSVSCKASRTDLFSRKFPYGANTYYDAKFKGLII